MYYRYRTFAERLGPHNAKSIVLHYFGVLALSYSLFSLRSWLVDYTDRCRCLPLTLHRLREPASRWNQEVGYTQPITKFLSKASAAIFIALMDYSSLDKTAVIVETTTTTTTTPAPSESADDEEDYYFGEHASVERAVASVEPYWASTLCKMRHSRNILVVAIRKYLDITSYYVPIAGRYNHPTVCSPICLRG